MKGGFSHCCWQISNHFHPITSMVTNRMRGNRKQICDITTGNGIIMHMVNNQLGCTPLSGVCKAHAVVQLGLTHSKVPWVFCVPRICNLHESSGLLLSLSCLFKAMKLFLKVQNYFLKIFFLFSQLFNSSSTQLLPIPGHEYPIITIISQLVQIML